jgi:hypothetical protein
MTLIQSAFLTKYYSCDEIKTRRLEKMAHKERENAYKILVIITESRPRHLQWEMTTRKMILNKEDMGVH